jgi:DHA2 family multidrug resistance protein
VAVVGIIAFIWRELAVKNPVVDLRLMRKRRFAVGSLFNFILGFGLFASVFIVPVFCQNLLGFTASQTGWLLMPGAIASGVMMPIVGNLLRKNYISPIWYAALGFALFFAFTYMLSNLTLNSGPDQFYWPLIIRGIGMGFIFIPLTTLSLIDLEGKEIPQGTALSNMVRQLGGAFGTAIVTTYISTRSMYHKAILGQHITMYDTEAWNRLKMMTGMFMSKGDPASVAHSKALSLLNYTVLRQALVLTYADTFLIIGGFFLLCIPLLLLFIGKREVEGALHIEMPAE